MLFYSLLFVFIYETSTEEAADWKKTGILSTTIPWYEYFHSLELISRAAFSKPLIFYVYFYPFQGI
jgi:hypothetical protein